MELNEERARYQNLLTEHINLEAQYADLKSEQDAATVRGSNVFTDIHTAIKKKKDLPSF